jgi:AraC-like DNA-binding protein
MPMTTLDFAARVLSERLTISETLAWNHGVGATAPPWVSSAPKILLIIQGKVRWTLEGRESVLAAGTMVFRPPWVISGLRVIGSTRARILHLEFTVPHIAEWPGVTVQRVADFQRERKAFESVFAWMKKGDPWSTLMAQAELKHILVRFLKGSSGSQVISLDAPEAPGDAESKRLIGEVVGDFSRNLHELRTIEDLADRANVSPGHFRRLFRTMYHMSPREFIMQARMRLARHYLMMTDLPIKGIGSRVGYPDTHHFSRVYRQFWKHTATDDRKTKL